MGVSEQFWLPLCILYIHDSSVVVFAMICIQLSVSAILSVVWAALVYQSTRYIGESVGAFHKATGVIGAWLVAAGCFFNACTWPFYFVAEQD